MALAKTIKRRIEKSNFSADIILIDEVHQTSSMDLIMIAMLFVRVQELGLMMQKDTKNHF